MHHTHRRRRRRPSTELVRTLTRLLFRFMHCLSAVNWSTCAILLFAALGQNAVMDVKRIEDSSCTHLTELSVALAANLLSDAERHFFATRKWSQLLLHTESSIMFVWLVFSHSALFLWRELSSAQTFWLCTLCKLFILLFVPFNCSPHTSLSRNFNLVYFTSKIYRTRVDEGTM